jgi:hypothetical protein
MKHIIDGVLALYHGFRATGLEPPEAIIVTRETGHELIALLEHQPRMIPMGPQQQLSHASLVQADGCMWWEVSINAVKVRWRAKPLERPVGGQSWI